MSEINRLLFSSVLLVKALLRGINKKWYITLHRDNVTLLTSRAAFLTVALLKMPLPLEVLVARPTGAWAIGIVKAKGSRQDCVQYSL